MAGSASGLEELLLGEIHETGVYDLAASVGMVAPDGRLQEAGQLEDAWAVSAGLSVLKQPAAMASPRLPHIEGGELAPVPVLTSDVDPAELAAADQALVSCLQAAGDAAVALRIASLQLEQWSLNEADSSGATAADGDSPSCPAEAAAAASLGALQAGSGAADGTPGASKRKRTGRGAQAAAAPAAGAGAAPSGRSSAGGDDGYGGAGKPGGRGGLRHFSMKVCEKVESKGDTSYEEVANELIAEMRAEVAAGLAEQQVDDKNVRRRAYDALNVLEAIGMISKTKKAIRWQGWPQGLGRSTEEKQRAERARALERLEQKRQALQDAVLKAHCLCNLALRNRDAPLPVLLQMQDMGLPVPNPLKLPFMLVQADQEAEVQVTISDDHLTAHLDFHHWPFVLYDDDRVMRLMGLHQPQAQLLAAQQQQQQPGQQQQQQQQQEEEIKQESQQEQEQPRQQQQQQQQQQHSVAGGTPSLQPSQHPGTQQQQQQQQQQQTTTTTMPAAAALPEAHGRPRLTPGRGQPNGRLPTPALQLSPVAGSPTAAGLGSSVSAMDLGSPPATVGRPGGAAAGPGAFFQPAAPAVQLLQQQQQQQQQPLLRPAAPAAAAAAAKAGAAARPGNGTVLPSLAPAGLHPVAPQLLPQLQPQQADWAQWAASSFGGALSAGMLPAQAPVPLLRPANMAAWSVVQQQQQQP